MQVHRRVTLGNNEADHKLNVKLNQLLYEDPIQVGDKVSLHRSQSTTAPSSHLDWIGPFEIVKTNDMVIQVRNEEGETDWIHRTHIRHLALRPKHLSHNCLPPPATSRTPTRSWITTPKSIHRTNPGTTFCTNRDNKPTQGQFQWGKHATKCQCATRTL